MFSPTKGKTPHILLLLAPVVYGWTPLVPIGKGIVQASAQENSSSINPDISNNQCANVSQSILTEIRGYKDTVLKISELIINGSYRGIAYKNLSDFVDTYGARLTGSESLERAIDHVLATMMNIGLNGVHSEDVIAPKWVRGHEELTMLAPYKKDIQLLGLLPSVQTPEEGITSEIVVVNSYEQLHASPELRSRVKGKILVFNHAFDDAVNAVTYRHRSAIEGSKLGAIATLNRAYATFSLSTPHTGEMHYEEDVPPIPAAEITIEDAELFGRLYDKGKKIVLNLKLRSQRLGNITTRNSIGDLTGTEKPEEYVLVSGHADSWDVGQGALDDGYGVILSMMVPEVLKSVGLIPKRTVRSIVWTAEEIGKISIGAQQYAEAHRNELQNYSMFLEADSGFFDTKGLIMNGSAEAVCIVEEILKLLEPTIIRETVVVTPFPDLKTDIVELMKASGVPGALPDTDFDKYFWYHHSNADTMTGLNPKDLDVCLAMLTSLSYVLADMSVMLPRLTI